MNVNLDWNKSVAHIFWPPPDCLILKKNLVFAPLVRLRLYREGQWP